MSTIAIFHISIEFWGIMLCFMALIGLIFGNTRINTNKGLKIIMQICCIMLLLNDSLAWGFKGFDTTAAYYVVRISNFIVFSLNYVYMGIFAVFLWKSVAETDDKTPLRIYMIWSLTVIGIILLIISQFNHMFYNFNEHNIYYRGTAYIVTQIIAVLGMFLDFTILMEYRKRLDNAIFFAMTSYFILPAIATVIIIFHYGLSLQNIAIVVSTQFMFAVDLIDVRRRLDKSEAEFIKARHAANHDLMTGLWNKVSGMESIKSSIKDMKDDDSASLAFIDIDDFKSINDIYGHSNGDYWIKEVAKLLINSNTKEDILCRFGGDEFIILVKGTSDMDTIKSRIYQFQQYLSMKSIEQGQDVHCSVGVCHIKGSGQDPDNCIKLADEALYEVKRGGKNSCVIYNVDGKKSVTPEKIQVDLPTSFKIQDKIFHKFVNIFSVVIYLELKDNSFSVIKEDEHFKNVMPLGVDFNVRLMAYVENEVADEYKDKVQKFFTIERIKGQTETLKSIIYKDKTGSPYIMYTIINTNNINTEYHNCLIAVQRIPYENE